MKAAFYTLGCKVNQYETQIMEQHLKKAGYEIVPPDSFADVYIVNSCTVTAESDRKTRQILRRLKSHNSGAVTVLTGCFPQSAAERASKIPEADIITGTKERTDIANILSEFFKTGEKIVNVSTFSKAESFEPMRAESFYGRTRAFVKIEDGCESYCSYCIIPKARGPVRSKPVDDIKNELSELSKNGYKEVVLVGINLSSYGKDCGLTLTDALSAACSTGIERIRLGSLEPNVITPDFVRHITVLKKICPHFHLSLQSGSASTLQRMNRRYSPEQFSKAVDLLRTNIAGCAITTDIIVGFPGESEEEFAQSLDFVRKIGFSQAHVFPYSKRYGTRAAEMSGQVSKAEKTRRVHIMAEAAAISRKEFLESHIGKTYPVLFESEKKGAFEGFTPDYVSVTVRSEKNLHGKILNTLITGLENEGCRGIINP